MRSGPQRLRIRAHAQAQSVPGTVRVVVNGAALQTFAIDRTGLYILEADLPQADEYTIEMHASPTWQVATDPRTFSLTVSMIRLVPQAA